MLSVEQLRDKLGKRGVNNTVVSELTGISRATISAIANGKNSTPNYKTLVKLSEHFKGA